MILFHIAGKCIGQLLCSCAIIVHQPWLHVREHVWLFSDGENAMRKLLEMWNLKLHRMNGNDRVLWWPCRQFMQYWNFDMLGNLGQALALEQISLKVKFIPTQAWNLHSPKITVLRVPGLVFSIWRIPSFPANKAKKGTLQKTADFKGLWEYVCELFFHKTKKCFFYFCWDF